MARAGSGLLGLRTARSHPAIPTSVTAKAALLIRKRFMGWQFVEGRGGRDGEGTEIRESECIHRIRERGARAVGAAARLRSANLRIEAVIARKRLQVPADDADGPVARSGHRADTVRGAHLADLGVRRVLHDVVVWPEHIIEPADAGALARPTAPLIAHGLCGLDRQVPSIESARCEIEESPALTLIVEGLPVRAVDQCIETQALVRDVVAVAEAEIRQRMADDLVDAKALARLAPERPIDDRHAEVQRHSVAKRGLRSGESRLP